MNLKRGRIVVGELSMDERGNIGIGAKDDDGRIYLAQREGYPAGNIHSKYGIGTVEKDSDGRLGIWYPHDSED